MKRIVLLMLAALPGSVLLNAQVVTALPASLTFTWQIGAALPAAQTVALKIASGTPAWTVSTPAADQWLIVSPATGTLPGTLSVQVNPSTLSPGTRKSTITLSVIGAANPVFINVTLTVTQVPAVPTVAPATLTMTSPGTFTGSFAVIAGSQSTTYAATTSPAWLTVTHVAGAILPAENATLTATVTPGALLPQAAPYVGKVTVVTTTNGVAKTLVVTVNLTVNSLPPTVNPGGVWPSMIPAGSPNTTVTIRGANFYSITTVTASASPTPLKTVLVSPTVLLATLPAATLGVAGPMSLTVTNPLGGGSAAPYPITVGSDPAIAGITNAASYAQGAVSPGEIITIFGANLGPSVPAQLTVGANGFVLTNTGGVGVTVDGVSAPIIYASAGQVSVQVPYAARLGTAAQGTARTLTLSFGTGIPANSSIDIVAAAPGLFTANASGSGQAILLNYDPVAPTVNSATVPAAPGSTIIFFLTGEGDYAGSVYSPETGWVVPAVPVPVPPATVGAYPQLAITPTVTVGGIPATVTYAGPIPTCILGLLQINAVVPAGVTAGPAVLLSVTIAGAASQPNVTLAVGP